VVHVLATRPDAVTLAPVYARLDSGATFGQFIVHTGEHTGRSMVGNVLRDLGLPAPERNLRVGTGSHGAQTARALAAGERALSELRPAAVVVTGDSNSALGCALAAAKLGIPVARVEAGLREHDWSVPEEVNRILLDRIADSLFAPTAHEASNLAAEGIDDARVHVVGSTAVSSLRRAQQRAGALRAWRTHGLRRGGYVLVTLHHGTNIDDDERLARIVEALASLAAHVPVVFPLHPRTRERLKPMGDAHRLRAAGVICCPPMSYLDFVSLETGAGAIVTDSGTIQEEASALGIPCYTLRSTTERVVTVSHGTNVLVGDDPRDLADVRPGVPTPCVIPKWDTRAGERIAAVLTANYAIVRASESF
jgi:UDP-N-acetylglucosamine 2-epimerase (non-hydrolysing)